MTVKLLLSAFIAAVSVLAFAMAPALAAHALAPQAPTLSDGAGQMIFSGANITVRLSDSAPSMQFSYPGQPQLAFRMQYTRCIAFNDTGDGRYQGSEALFAATMAGAQWQNERFSPNAGSGGGAVGLRMRATLDMVEQERPDVVPPAGQQGGQTGTPPFQPRTIASALRITFTYELHQYNGTYGGPEVQLRLQGGNELKIGITVEPLVAIPATHLAVEQSLSGGSESGEGEFQLYGSEGPVSARAAVDEKQGDQEMMHSFEERNSAQQRIGYAAEANKDKGFYTWVTGVEARGPAGNANASMATSFRTDGTSLKLYGSFGLVTGASEYYIDPTIGVVPDILDDLADAVIDYASAHRQSLAVGGAVGGVLSLAIVLVKGAGKKGDSVTLKDNRYYKGERK